MTVPEIEKYVLTSDEAAAIAAAVSSTMMDLMMGATMGDDMDAVTPILIASLQSGLKKVMSLNNELRKGLNEVRKEHANA